MEDWNLEQAQEPRFNMQHNDGIHMEYYPKESKDCRYLIHPLPLL